MLNLSATLEGTPIPLNTLDDLEALYQFIGTYLRWTRKSSHMIARAVQRATRTQKPRSTPSFGGRNPPIGERVIDYAEQIIKDHPDGLTPIQLADKMAARGWTTRSDDPPRIVHLRLKEHPDMFSRNDSGKWVLTNTTKTQPEPQREEGSLALITTS